MRLWGRRKKQKIVVDEGNANFESKLDITGWKVLLPRACIREVLDIGCIVEVNQPKGVALISVFTPKANAYRLGDIVKVYGQVVKQHFSSLTIQAESVSLIGNLRELRSKTKVVD